MLGASCEPVACAEGRVGAPCDGAGDDARCDTSAGAGDGRCDACPITGGFGSENEMFQMVANYLLATLEGAVRSGISIRNRS